MSCVLHTRSLLLTYTEVLDRLTYPLILPVGFLNTHDSPVSPQAETLKEMKHAEPYHLVSFPVPIPVIVLFSLIPSPHTTAIVAYTIWYLMQSKKAIRWLDLSVMGVASSQVIFVYSDKLSVPSSLWSS